MRNVILYSFVTIVLLVHLSASEHTWKPLTNVRTYTMRVNPLNKNTIYVGNADNRILRSYNAGVSWDTITFGALGSGSHLTTFHICHNDTNVLLVGGYVHEGLRRSVDGGKNWETVLSDPTFRRIWFVSEAVVDDPRSPDILYAARGSVVNEVYRSKDCGATWEMMGEVSNTITTKLHTIAIRPDSSNILFTGCQSGVIARSDDSGRTWRKVPVTGMQPQYSADAEIPKITFSKSNPLLGYAIVTISNPDLVDGNGGTLKSTDGGASWNRIAHEDTSLWAVEVHPVGSREDIWVGGFRTFTLPTVIKGDSIVRRSTDGGVTWKNYDDVPWQANDEDRVIANIWVIKYDTLSERIYLCTESGLYLLDEPVSVNDDEPAPYLNAVYANIIGNGIEITSEQTHIQRIQVYSLLGTLLSDVDQIQSTQHTVAKHTFPSGMMYVVVCLADGSKRVFSLVNRE